MTIADRIRNRRLQLGLSVDDLAERLHKNRATVYRYESNHIKSYSPDVMDSLAEALHITPSYFYGFDDPSDDPADPPHTSEARILARGADRLSPEERRQLLDMARVMFRDIFDKEENHDAGL